MDFVFLTFIMNFIWYIFTTLLLLYKFTSFFSYVYNFLLFCGNFLSSFVYIKDQIALNLLSREGYLQVTGQEKKSVWHDFKNKCKKAYNSFWNKEEELEQQIIQELPQEPEQHQEPRKDESLITIYPYNPHNAPSNVFISMYEMQKQNSTDSIEFKKINIDKTIQNKISDLSV